MFMVLTSDYLSALQEIAVWKNIVLKMPLCVCVLVKVYFHSKNFLENLFCRYLEFTAHYSLSGIVLSSLNSSFNPDTIFCPTLWGLGKKEPEQFHCSL